MKYDIIVIGGGPGGYVAAIKAAQEEKKVLLVEKEVVGGVCLNHGCIPTKAMLKNAKTYKTMLDAKSFGVLVEGTVTYDFSLMMRRKNQVVKRLTTGVSGLLKKNGVTVINGYAKAINNNTIEVNNEKYECDNLIIATGAHPFIPPINGLKEAIEKEIALTSRELLQIESVPKTLAIIGGGVIGVEFATIFSSLGSEVTIFEMQPGILPMIDDDIRSNYEKILTREGIKIHTSTEVNAVNENEIKFVKDNKEETLKADKILVSVGMRPNLGGLEALNLELDRGAIKTDDKLKTNLENVYAIGDVNGKFMLAHVASHEGLVAVDQILGGNKTMDYTKVPNAIYGSPEIASIGLTEREAKEQNLNYKTFSFPLIASGKALADNEKEGFIKLIVEEQYKEILGAHILSYNASDLITEIGVTMELEGTAYEIANTIHPHPTLSEIIMEAALGAIDKPIHL